MNAGNLTIIAHGCKMVLKLAYLFAMVLEYEEKDIVHNSKSISWILWVAWWAIHEITQT